MIRTIEAIAIEAGEVAVAHFGHLAVGSNGHLKRRMRVVNGRSIDDRSAT